MTIWVDAQLPPGIAAWSAETFGIAAIAVRELGLRDADDRDIFAVAKAQDAIVMASRRRFSG